MHRVRIKICGITTPEDAEAAVAAGADAIGLVFYAPSSRAVSLEQARIIARAVPPFVSLTGLFVDATEAVVRTVLNRVPLDCLQFHGDEPAAFCESFGRSWIKAVRVAGADSLARTVLAEYRLARGLLLDAFDPVLAGGSGRVFNWDLVPSLPQPLILAGGLHADNVGEAVRRVRPWAVDVSSGVEASPGRKDAERLQKFVAAVRAAERELSHD